MIDAFIASTPNNVNNMLKQSPFGVATTKFLLSLFVVYPFAVLLQNIKSKDGMYTYTLLFVFYLLITLQ